MAVANAAQLQCDYQIAQYKSSPERLYVCEGTITTTPGDFTVGSVTGNHIPNYGNGDVVRITIRNVSVAAMPKNLGAWFKNFKEVAISHIVNIPNFQRGDFSEMTHLTGFYAKNLPKVGEVPRDAFWDLKDLTHLYLEKMVNMGNLHGDLLINARSLTVFSAKGPNRVTQINPGFFRSQGETLRIVDFRDTNLVKIGFSVFQNIQNMLDGRFLNAGCLNRYYVTDVVKTLTTDIRAHCQDVTGGQNFIEKMQASSSSSDSSESK